MVLGAGPRRPIADRQRDCSLIPTDPSMRIVLGYPVAGAAHRSSRRRRSGRGNRRCRPARHARSGAGGGHLLRPRQGTPHSLGAGRGTGPAAVDPVLGRRHRPLPDPRRRRVADPGDQRLGTLRRSGGRTDAGAAAGTAPRLPVFFRAAQRKEFIRRPTADLHGTTVGIIGFGGNGRRLAELLAPFRTRILATDYFPVDRPAQVERLCLPSSSAAILPQCDIVILCVPLTDRDRGMIDAQALAAMKPGAVLINVARGPVVVESALVDALEYWTPERRGAGRDGSRAPASVQPPVGSSQRDHHTPRRCPVPHALRRRDPPVLRESGALPARPSRC